MEKPDPSSFAAFLVERYEKDAYTRAVMYLMEKHKSGDQAGERFGLQLVMAVQQLLQERFPEDGIVPTLMLSLRQFSSFSRADVFSSADDQFTKCPDPAEIQTRTVH